VCGSSGLLFVNKVAGPFADLTTTANILMSLVIDHFGLFGMETHEVGKVGLPKLVWGGRRMSEVIGRFYQNEGRARDQAMVLQQPINAGLGHKTALLSVKSTALASTFAPSGSRVPLIPTASPAATSGPRR